MTDRHAPSACRRSTASTPFVRNAQTPDASAAPSASAIQRKVSVPGPSTSPGRTSFASPSSQRTASDSSASHPSVDSATGCGSTGSGSGGGSFASHCTLLTVTGLASETRFQASVVPSVPSISITTVSWPGIRLRTSCPATANVHVFPPSPPFIGDSQSKVSLPRPATCAVRVVRGFRMKFSVHADVPSSFVQPSLASASGTGSA